MFVVFLVHRVFVVFLVVVFWCVGLLLVLLLFFLGVFFVFGRGVLRFLRLFF